MKDDTMLARWLNNELDEKELKEFMASPEYRTYNRIKEYSARLTAPEADMDSLYMRIRQNKHNANKAPKVRRLNPWIGRVAAVLAVVLGATYFFYTTHTTTRMAANGEHMAFTLPDNSTVMLNAGSQADYKTWNWDSNRKLTLEGEAYFKVAKGKTFDVSAKWGTVTVVGTQFNVRNREDRFDVTCFEGKVRVSCNGTTMLLTPGQGISFENGKLLKTLKDANAQPGWLTYDMRYSEEPLANVLDEIERQHNVTITVAGPMPAKKFGGYIKMNDLDAALTTLETIYQLKAEKAGDKIILASE